MDDSYLCPLVDVDIDETICYDIQMVSGPGSLINRRILDYYASILDASKITDKRTAKFCTDCPFNQLSIQPIKSIQLSVARPNNAEQAQW